jgi:hypothetical protein
MEPHASARAANSGRSTSLNLPGAVSISRDSLLTSNEFCHRPMYKIARTSTTGKPLRVSGRYSRWRPELFLCHWPRQKDEQLSVTSPCTDGGAICAIRMSN